MEKFDCKVAGAERWTRRVALTIVLCCGAGAALACGTERWAVKTATDLDASKINPAPIAATIGELTAFTVPGDARRQGNRRWPQEMIVYRVSGLMTVVKHEADGDYHVVIADTQGRTMIVESPEPDCIGGSRFAAQITAARRSLDARFARVRRARPNIPITVEGVAFFDPIHGQEGVAPNGIELHPILSVEFADK